MYSPPFSVLHFQSTHFHPFTHSAKYRLTSQHRTAQLHLSSQSLNVGPPNVRLAGASLSCLTNEWRHTSEEDMCDRVARDGSVVTRQFNMCSCVRVCGLDATSASVFINQPSARVFFNLNSRVKHFWTEFNCKVAVLVIYSLRYIPVSIGRPECQKIYTNANGPISASYMHCTACVLCFASFTGYRSGSMLCSRQGV